MDSQRTTKSPLENRCGLGIFSGHEQPAILDAQVAMLEYWSKTVGTPALVLEIFTKDQQFILDRLLGDFFGTKFVGWASRLIKSPFLWMILEFQMLSISIMNLSCLYYIRYLLYNYLYKYNPLYIYFINSFSGQFITFW